MGAQTNYFIKNNIENWKHARLENTIITEKGLTNIEHTGIYYSLALDSQETKTVWHRLSLFYEEFHGKIIFSYYASDDKQIKYGSSWRDFDELLLDENLDIKEIEKDTNTLWCDTIEDPKDALLHKAKGRYLWFKIELNAFEDIKPVISKIKIEYPMESFMKYLPDIYSRNEDTKEFLTGFIGIFQSLYLDIEEKIDKINHYLDPNLVDPEFLKWLAYCVGIEEQHLWPHDRLRELVLNAHQLYNQKGTKKGLEKLIQLYTGIKPMILEGHQVFEHIYDDKQKNIYEKLYGNSPYIFTVILKESDIPHKMMQKNLVKIIDSYKPAYTVGILILLKNNEVLGQHIYLGLNSKLAQPSFLKLDGNATIPFDTMIGIENK